MKIDHFIKAVIRDDIKNNKFKEKLAFRFPPEPNGYLHLGHVKSIILNSSCAKEFDGVFNLRFDDTNPLKEKTDYVSAIKNDVEWLLKEKVENIYFASDYFSTIFNCAIHLIKEGLAYVDDSDMETIKKERGDFHHKGVNSKFRDRTIEENLSLFMDMKKGLFKDGEKVLRAKIDMSHNNLNLRDPVIFRIRHAYHHNTHNEWCIYPMYDFAHPISDAIEKISHSLCSL
jgi:glutaminyl-tRNA synthetase